MDHQEGSSGFTYTRKERRAHIRIGIRVRIRLSSPRPGQLSGWARNISVGGIYVEVGHQLPVGTTCHLEIPIRDDHTLYTLKPSGQVIHLTGNGMGIQFRDLSPEEAAVIQNLVDGFIPGAEPEPVPGEAAE